MGTANVQLVLQAQGAKCCRLSTTGLRSCMKRSRITQCMDHRLDELEHSVRHDLSLSLFVLLPHMPAAPFAESAQTTGAYCCSASKHNRGAMWHLPSSSDVAAIARLQGGRVKVRCMPIVVSDTICCWLAGLPDLSMATSMATSTQLDSELLAAPPYASSELVCRTPVSYQYSLLHVCSTVHPM